MTDRNKHFQYALPKFGFEYGAARITRMAHIEGRYHVLAIDTRDHHIQVGVSPTGRSVRVWRDGEELTTESALQRTTPRYFCPECSAPIFPVLRPPTPEGGAEGGA